MTPKVVFHVPHTTEEARAGALGNVANLLGDGTIDPEIAVVFNAGGVDAVVEGSPHEQRVRELGGTGVELLLCSNSLSRSGHHDGTVLDGVELVSSGMAELTRRQADGYGYIRP